MVPLTGVDDNTTTVSALRPLEFVHDISIAPIGKATTRRHCESSS